MKTKLKFAGLLGAIAGLVKSPFQRAFDNKKAKKGPVNGQPRMRLGTDFNKDPYPNHRHKSSSEKASISAWRESRRKHVVTVGTNHDRVVEARAKQQGLTVDEYKLKYQS